MLQAVLLYGSKARGDGDPSSDTDLVGVSIGGVPAKVFDERGLSFHRYPLDWLIEEARAGELFSLHLCREAVPIFDPEKSLEKLRAEFRPKINYSEDIESGCRVVAAFVRMNPENFSASMRRRYFWGLRTAIMGAAADAKRPAFSSAALEDFAKFPGLDEHIRNRSAATFEECCELGPRIILTLGAPARVILESDVKQNLERLFEFTGVAAATAGEIIYGF